MGEIRATDLAHARRNLHPHAEALLAMALWPHDYAHKQRGGSMDFWDKLPEEKKRYCRDTVSAVLKALEDAGRADA